MLVPRQMSPPLELEMLVQGHFSLDQTGAKRGALRCFHRGLHCALCAKYLSDLENRTEAFAERGVETIAISTDDRGRADAMAEKIKAENLCSAFDLSLAVARDWGLYTSTSRGKTSAGVEQPALFAEPGVFLAHPDRTLYWASVQTMRVARPNFGELLSALDFVIANNYPARGEYTGTV